MKGKKIVVTVLAVWAGLFLLLASSAWAETCETDLNCDGEVNQLDRKYFNETYKAERGITNCNPRIPAPVPKTGQITQYAVGDDGNYQAGVASPEPRFTDNEDGTVTDNLTGLIWLKDANLAEGEVPTLQEALNFVSNMNDGEGTFGYTDWRLPNMRELFSLIDCGAKSPALSSGHPFENVQWSSNNLWMYWSSTTYTGNTSHVWCMYMRYGRLGFCNKGGDTQITYLWPVRGGQ